MASGFFAILSRLKYINRWALMRNTERENLSEHSLETAFIAHALAVIKNRRLGGNVNVDRVALIAMFHDTTEILTGDLPTPIKYYNPSIKDAYKQVEHVAADRLLEMLPQQLRQSYTHLVHEDDPEVLPTVKAADKLSAYIKCVEEQKGGNTEFDSAAKATMKAMREMNLAELDWFIENCLPAFSLDLDQL